MTRAALTLDFAKMYQPITKAVSPAVTTPTQPDRQPQQESEILLSLDNAGIERNGRWLVRNIGFELHKGEIVTLIGPNGSGKSTTAKLALGIHKPDEGHVRRDKSLTIGYVPQKIVIDPESAAKC